MYGRRALWTAVTVSAKQGWNWGSVFTCAESCVGLTVATTDGLLYIVIIVIEETFVRAGKIVIL